MTGNRTIEGGTPTAANQVLDWEVGNGHSKQPLDKGYVYWRAGNRDGLALGGVRS